MQDNMRKELCIDTVRTLCSQYKLSESVILHSDHGSQYCIKYTMQAKSRAEINDFSSAFKYYGLSDRAVFAQGLKRSLKLRLYYSLMGELIF